MMFYIRFFIGFLVLHLVVENLYGQHKVGYEVGVGSFRMDEMPLLQEYFNSESDVDLEVTSSFPPYLFYQLLYGYNHSNSEFGLGLRYTSTGGRMATSDYSGSLTYDQLLQMYSIGISYGGILAKSNDKLFIRFKWLVYYDLSNLKLKNTLKIGEEEQSEEIALASSGLSLLPMLLIDYQFGHQLSAFFAAGYELNPLNQAFHQKGNKDAILSTPDGNIGPDWTGYRFSFGITYTIKTKKN
jgi:hypothetical protein